MSEQLPLWSFPASTGSSADSHAKTSPEPAKVPGSTESAPGCGGSTDESSPPSGPPSSSSRTSRAAKAGGCALCGGACMNSDITRPLSGSPRKTSARHTSGSGSSLWPTARARDHKGMGFGDDLPGAVRGRWPSPSARDGTAGAGHGAKMQGAPSLRTVVGGDAARLPAGLDRNPGRAIRWPASPGEQQHGWEPPRAASGVPQQSERLIALGNAVVPACAEEVGRWIVQNLL